MASACGAPPPGDRPAPQSARSTRYEDLVTLFNEWRTFQRPTLVNGVPDYTAGAMAAQHKALSGFQSRLAAIEPSGWPIPQQADYHIVRAEMHGLDFDHRVLRPWANNPAFYVTIFPSESDQPAREGPFAYGAVELWSYQFPLSARDAETVATGLRAVPGLLAQARTNLIGNGKDLWVHGARDLRQQSADLQALAARLTAPEQGLAQDIERAKVATDEFAAWLEKESGVEDGTFRCGRGELRLVSPARHAAALHVARPRHADGTRACAGAQLAGPRRSQQRGASAADANCVSRGTCAPIQRRRVGVHRVSSRSPDHDRARLHGAGVRARIGRFSPGPREFFTEVDYRDPEVMRTHGYHWFDKGRMVHLPHASPIRRGPLLYNIFISRTEGLATGWEEMMMHAGMFDARPRTRELIYILLAQRAARALGDLRMHGEQASIETTAAFTAAHTPRGWLRLDGNLVRFEQHLYLQQPGYGISYVVGKIEIEKLLADRQRQLGDRFTMTSSSMSSTRRVRFRFRSCDGN